MLAEIVPPEILTPPDAYSRGFHRHNGALVIDGWLRRLAGQDARCRMVLGRLARAFLHVRGQQGLGFARLGDYARERLGMSARELQSLVRVSARLEGLPEIRRAYENGEVSWAQVRLLIGVATPDTEGGWLALARGRTVRALAARIRGVRGGEGGEDDDAEEPHIRFRVRCPRRLPRVWRDTVELARRMAGTELTVGQAAEAIAAEGLSGRPAAPDPWPALWRPAAEPTDPDETHAAFPPALDWAAVREAIPMEVERLADGCETADPFVLDARLRRVVGARQRIDWQMGRLLRVFLDRRLCRLMGFRSADHYATERLGCSARKVGALVTLERKSWQAPALGDAYRAGEVSWVRALAVLPVVGEQTAAAWVARAQEVTVRRLVDEVEWALAGRLPCEPVPPPPAGASLAGPERQMGAHGEDEWPEAGLAFTAPASVVALFQTAILAFRGPGQAHWQGLEALLDHVTTEWAGQPRHRDPVFARDGWRCAVPGCTSRRNLHDHHLLFRSRGGDNGRENRITVCAAHHLHGIHAGRVRAWGVAPDDVTWELGVRQGREPLLRLRGDRYVSPAA